VHIPNEIIQNIFNLPSDEEHVAETLKM